MEEKIRKTGIDIIGDAPWGTHLCQFYQSKEDLIDTLVPYFKAGLENNEFCMWITSEPLGIEDAKRSLKNALKDLDEYIEKDQIEILDYSQWYTRSGKFESDKVLQGWVEKEEQAIKKGFDGLRLTGNTFWLEKKDWKNFTDYEEEINNVIGQHRMMAICTYSLDRCGIFEVIDVINNHQFALIRKEGNWEIIESSERKRVWEAFRESEEKLSSFIGSATDGFVLFDSELNLIEINKKALEIFPDDITKEDVIGKNILEISPGLEKTGRYDQYCEVIKTGKPSYYEDVVPGPRFGNRHLSVRAFRVAEGLGLIFTDITERKKMEEALKNAAEEKEILLREAHHRIKNNFAIVSSLLKMQSAKIKDPDDLEIFKESQNHILIMARLHEVLHQTEVIGKVNMKAYLTKIINSLCNSYKVDANRIKVKSNIDELELNPKTATSCALIVNELFTNAYKYGFPDGRKGEVNITMRSLKGDEIELIVTDNGVGLSKKVDFRNTGGLGLHLVKILAEDQHHGEIKLDRTKGTSFHIRMRTK